MRVLILSEWYPSTSAPTTGLFVQDQAKAVARRHDVVVLVHDRKKASLPLIDVRSKVEDGLHTLFVRTWPPPGTKLGRLLFWAAADRIVQRWRDRGEGPDVIHAHVVTAGLLALLLARRRSPVVVTEHNTNFIEGRGGWTDRRIARLVLRHADVVTGVSVALLQSLGQLEPNRRFELVPNVVDVAAFEVAEATRTTRGLNLRFLLVARLDRQKGIQYLIEALALVREQRSDFTLDIVGDGPLRPLLEQLVIARGLRDIVRFHGAAERGEVVLWMGRSDVFVLPSIVETFGIVLVEAIAAEMPIITTTAIPDHDRLSPFGVVVPPADPAALRDGILHCLAGDFSFDRAKAAAFVSQFSPSRIARRWDAIYELATADRKPADELHRPHLSEPERRTN